VHFTLADLATDIAQNACESGAALVELELTQSGSRFTFVIRDNGKGMGKAQLARALDPFVTDGIKHPHRKVGLGLPFLVQTAGQSGGGWDIKSEEGAGTTVTAWFDMAGIDTPPLGDLPGLMRSVLMFEGPAEVVIRRKRQAEGEQDLDYEVCKSLLEDALGSLEDTGSLILLGKYLRSLEEDGPLEEDGSPGEN
jgi:hypothetical protein